MRNRLLLPLVGALAVVALSLPASSFAETCPPGQTGTPPYCQNEPSNKFNLGKVKHPATGVVTIRVKVSSGGVFVATGKSMQTATAKGKAAGSFTLTLKLTKKGLEELNEAKGQQLRVKVKFTFTPDAGKPRTKYKKLIFRVVRGKGSSKK
ncbi:MAG TPA: hypothetical protein VF245_03315 [Solirubrobacterales bacterium]